ncbi:hypothetical protein CS063_16905 [Sporanaerobium hydrogeniformans]|uniref:Uncharacterized protein n=1 Tax=Sporanaerobium hydrogeniformans TaxID=3072179 RepID=A0AC61D8X8_9FIRM|nr:hypothetical protein [Sporanaerobium hydrogeniformans]PHV69221.1 hypothetical protein CS063_16905 [Sporanaerobium hydrogeniformans]
MKLRTMKKRYNNLKEITMRLNKEIGVIHTALGKSAEKNIHLAREQAKLYKENQQLSRAYMNAIDDNAELKKEINIVLTENKELKEKLKEITANKLMRLVAKFKRF